MADRWFRLPETTRELPDRNVAMPDLKGYDVDGWSGNKAHPDGAPYWVVRVHADAGTLDALSGESNVIELAGVPTEALNQMLGQTRDATGWERGFGIQ